LALSVSITARSEEQEPEISDFDDFDELYLGELLNTVFTAAKHEQDIAEAPSAITVITREDIETSGARTLPEALRIVPNIDVFMIKPLWYSVGLRGKTSESSDSLLLLVDGRDVTWELLGAPIWTVQHFSMDEIERIEVIRGPGSSLYGPNAYVGVVNVITRSPGEGPTTSASLRGGERGVTELACRGNIKLGPVALSADAGVVREDLWSGRDVTGRDAVRGRIQAQVELGSSNRLLLDAGALQGTGLLHSDMGLFNIHDAKDIYGRLRFEFDDLMVQAIFDRVKLDAEVDMRLYYADLNMELARAPPIVGHFDKIAVQAQHGVEMFHNRFTYGAEWAFNGYHAEIFFDPDQYEHRLGLFLQDEVNLSALINKLFQSEIPKLVLTLGLRFDYNNMMDIERTDYTFSPRAALVFRPNKDHSFRIGYAHAFLKPTFFESSLHINLIDVNNLNFTSLELGNPDLKNQTIASVDLGYGAYFFKRRLLIKIDIAFNWYRNSIGFSFRPSRMEYRNVAGVLIPDLNSPGMMEHRNDKGGDNSHNVDLHIMAKPTDSLRLFFSAGYRQLYNAKTLRFRRGEPIFRLAAGVDLRGEPGWKASLRAFYTGKHYRNIGNPESVIEKVINLVVDPAFFINARFAWTLDDDPFGITVGLEVFNLLGTGFRETGGISFPNTFDHAGDLMGRRIVLFVQGEI
jgi:iron complex outermembrane receptor protein